MSEQKLLKEELDQITVLQEEYSKITILIGQAEIRKMILERELDETNNSITDQKTLYIENQTKEIDFITSLNKKYGDGNVNLDKGIFIPSEK